MVTPATGRPNGRPTLYNPAYCEVVLEEMAKGYSIGAVAAVIGVSRDTIINWAKEHPEFFLAVSRGRALRQRQWETATMIGAFAATDAQGKPKPAGNPALLQFGLKSAAREDWYDEVRLAHSGAVGNYDVSKLTIEQLHALRSALAAASIDPGEPESAEASDPSGD